MCTKCVETGVIKYLHDMKIRISGICLLMHISPGMNRLLNTNVIFNYSLNDIQNCFIGIMPMFLIRNIQWLANYWLSNDI